VSSLCTPASVCIGGLRNGRFLLFIPSVVFQHYTSPRKDSECHIGQDLDTVIDKNGSCPGHILLNIVREILLEHDRNYAPGCAFQFDFENIRSFNEADCSPESACIFVKT